MSTLTRISRMLNVTVIALAGAFFGPVASQTAGAPGLTGPCPITEQTVTISGSLEAYLFYPSGSTCTGGPAAPFPAVVFAHGFSPFPQFVDSAADNADNGRHLASWGLIVAIPKLDTDFETRVSRLGEVLDYLSAQNDLPGSPLQGKVDVNRLATAGHSLGGATALALAARDPRIRAVVALDPVYHASDMSGNEGAPVWSIAEAAQITAPAAILGAPPHACNAQADHADLYPVVGSIHRATYGIANASHCDFASPGNAFCSLTCGSTSVDRTLLSKRYMTAWFNYYLHRGPEAYTVLFGAEAAQDIAAGRITSQIDTAPHGLHGLDADHRVWLRWDPYDHPMVAGYNIFRRTAGGSSTLIAQLGVTAAYTDTGVSVGQVYTYTACSVDPAGNLHGLTDGVVITVANLTDHLYLPALGKAESTP